MPSTLTAPQLANVIHEAAFRKRFDEPATRAAMARAHGRRRLARLQAALAMNAEGSAGTKSRPEDRFLEFVAGLPTPDINVEVEGVEVDFRWPGLIVEVDGEGHERPRTRREDRAKEARLKAAGYSVLRLPAADLDAPSRPALAAAASRTPSAARTPPPRPPWAP